MADVSNTIIYFAPHQDDELLSMGVDICNSLKKGKSVHVVLCTDGSGSSVKRKLNDGKSCNKHPGEHIYDLSEQEFIQARDTEFVASCLALGVKRENIHIPIWVKLIPKIFNNADMSSNPITNSLSPKVDMKQLNTNSGNVIINNHPKKPIPIEDL